MHLDSKSGLDESFITGRRPHHVSAQDGLALHVLQAELAHVQPPQAGVLLRVGRVVPRVQLVAAKHDGLDHVAALRHLAGQTQLLLYVQTTKKKKKHKKKGKRGDINKTSN